MTPLLQASDLAVGYAPRGGERRVVVSGVSLRLAAGEMVCLLGPNGAGKSTLLRTLAGMQTALAGDIELLGRALAAWTPRQLARRVGVVLPERARVGMLTARALVALGRYPHTDWLGRLRPGDERTVERALAAVGAAELAPRRVTALSDGELQKVMVARALAQEPTLLILDEPTAFLDLPGRVEMMGLLGGLAHGDSGAAEAVLLSTHDLDLALRTADRLWLLDREGGLTVGVPEDLVLSGAFRAAFDTAAVAYDALSGSFRLERRPRGTVWLGGDGVAAHWTRHALERKGFRVAGDPDGRPPGELAVEVGEAGGWRSRAGGEERRHRSIDELLTYLESVHRRLHDDRERR